MTDFVHGKIMFAGEKDDEKNWPVPASETNTQEEAANLNYEEDEEEAEEFFQSDEEVEVDEMADIEEVEDIDLSNNVSKQNSWL